MWVLILRICYQLQLCCRLLSEISEKRHEPETRLCFGASKFEAVLPTVRAATLAALMQNLNQMAVVGLVSIPGMMTGQVDSKPDIAKPGDMIQHTCYSYFPCVIL